MFTIGLINWKNVKKKKKEKEKKNAQRRSKLSTVLSIQQKKKKQCKKEEKKNLQSICLCLPVRVHLCPPSWPFLFFSSSAVCMFLFCISPPSFSLPPYLHIYVVLNPDLFSGHEETRAEEGGGEGKALANTNTHPSSFSNLHGSKIEYEYTGGKLISKKRERRRKFLYAQVTIPLRFYPMRKSCVLRRG